MDGLDQKILYELQIYGIQKSETLSSSVGIGSRTIRRRLNEMKKEGIYRPVVIPNWVLLEKRAMAKIGINASSDYMSDVAKALVNHPLVFSLAKSFGRFDFIIDIQMDTFETLAHFVNSELTSIKGIQKTETLILMSPRKFYNYLWPEIKIHEKCKYCNNTIIRKSNVDSVDRKIIDIITQTGLISIPLLKSTIKISEGSIRKRIKEMREHKVFRIEAMIDPSVYNTMITATIGIKVNKYPAHEIIDQIVDHPSIYLASTSVGRYNIIFGIQSSNMAAFTKFINEELKKIPGVNQLDSFVHSQFLKLHNIKFPL